MAGVGRKAAADAAATCLFMACFSLAAPLSELVAPHVALSPAGAGLGLVLGLLVAMGPACRALGGALYNPANNAFLFALGRGSAREHAVRAVAQAVGAVAGGAIAQRLLPAAWAGHLPGLALGLRPGADLLGGVAAEFALGAVLTWVVLACEDLRCGVLKLWLPLLATILAVKAGEDVSGPSLNPAFTFAWVFLHPGSQTTAEHLLVYWLAPLSSGLFGGWAFLGWQQFLAQRGWRSQPPQQQQQQQQHAKAD